MGNGLCGPEVMMGQMTAYTTFLRWICMTGNVVGIVKADDSVLVSVKGSFEFQVMRTTIQLVFPHIMGNEWLVAQLVGKEVVAPARSTFHFNSAGKCFKYDVDMDFVGAFTSVVKDPLIVDILLGRALIGKTPCWVSWRNLQLPKRKRRRLLFNLKPTTSLAISMDNRTKRIIGRMFPLYPWTL